MPTGVFIVHTLYPQFIAVVKKEYSQFVFETTTWVMCGDAELEKTISDLKKWFQSQLESGAITL